MKVARGLHGKIVIMEENVDVLLSVDDMVLLADNAESLQINLR